MAASHDIHALLPMHARHPSGSFVPSGLPATSHGLTCLFKCRERVCVGVCVCVCVCLCVQICARDPKLPALPTLAVPGTGDADVDGDMALVSDTHTHT